MTDVNFGSQAAVNAAKLANSAAAKKPDAAGEAVSKGVETFRDALEQAEAAAIDTAIGGADPHAMVEALANAEMVVEAAVTVRDKVVEAYQELLRMPV
ncbi:MAG: flagellar hook-basal body complex protein FliE [Pseudomonadota bacterium]